MKKTILILTLITAIALCGCGKTSASDIDNIKTKEATFHEIEFAVPEYYEVVEDDLFEADAKYDSMFFVNSNNDKNFICVARYNDDKLTDTLPEDGEEKEINGIKGKRQTMHGSNVFKTLSTYTFNIKTENGIIRYEISGDDETDFEVALKYLEIK